MSRKPSKRAARRAAPSDRGTSIPPDAVERDVIAPRPGDRRPGDRRPADRRPADHKDNPALNLGRTARRLRESQNLTLADVAHRASI